MSFLDKTLLGENGKHFYFDGYRLIDSLVTFFQMKMQQGKQILN